jgi:DUF1016 N-terminal domain
MYAICDKKFLLLLRPFINRTQLVKGYSAQNLWYMRQFYVEYHQSVILPPLAAEIGWSRNIIILEKCKNEHMVTRCSKGFLTFPICETASHKLT